MLKSWRGGQLNLAHGTTTKEIRKNKNHKPSSSEEMIRAVASEGCYFCLLLVVQTGVSEPAACSASELSLCIKEGRGLVVDLQCLTSVLWRPCTTTMQEYFSGPDRAICHCVCISRILDAISNEGFLVCSLLFCLVGVGAADTARTPSHSNESQTSDVRVKWYNFCLFMWVVWMFCLN